MFLNQVVNRKLILWNTLLLAIFFGFLLVFYFIYQAQRMDNSVIDEKVAVSLGLESALYPEDTGVIRAYQQAIADNAITWHEYNHISRLMSDYQNQTAQDIMHYQTFLKQQAAPRTALQKAQDNLEAYDEIGALVIPENKRARVRQALVNEINALRHKQGVQASANS